MSVLILAVVLAGDVELTKCEQGILEQTNVERRKRGLRALTIDPVLQKAARAHCRWMALRGRMEHSKGRNINHTSENVAGGQRTGREAVRDWMTSQGHRRNLLDPRAVSMGCCGYMGKARNPIAGTYFIQQFRRNVKKTVRR